MRGVSSHVVIGATSASIALALSGCATSGVIVPAHPLPSSTTPGAAPPSGFELGSHLGAEAGADTARASSGAYLRTPIRDHVELVSGLHSGVDAGYGPLFSGLRPDPPRFSGLVGGGGVGMRFSYPLLAALIVGVGVWGEVDLVAHAGRVFPRATTRVEVPVAERLFEDLWVYARPSVSLSAPLRGTLDVGPASSSRPPRLALPVTASFGLAPLYGEVSCPVGLGLYLEERLGIFVEGGYQTDTGAVGLSVGASWTM